MRNKHSFLFCLIGGLLIVIDGTVTGSIGFFEKLSIIPTIPELAAYADQLTFIIGILIYVLAAIAALGGIAVIGGGYLLTTDRFGTGKFVIGLGAGSSLIGLIIKLVTEIWIASSAAPLLNFVSLVMSSIGWIGIILSILGRRSASKPE